jgi:hypothetical protein
MGDGKKEEGRTGGKARASWLEDLIALLLCELSHQTDPAVASPPGMFDAMWELHSRSVVLPRIVVAVGLRPYIVLGVPLERNGGRISLFAGLRIGV